jgi:hypothetical protein
MKLVTQYFELDEAEDASQRLRQSGVMTVVTGKQSYELGTRGSGPSQLGLWVVFDDQLEDAKKFLSNPEHIPERVISLEQMEEIEQSTKGDASQAEKHFIKHAGVLILGLVVVVLLAYAVLRIGNVT